MSPCTAVRYGSSSAAHMALASLGGPDVRKHHRLQPCSDCQGWHVTARPRRTSGPHLRHRLCSLPVLTARTG